MTYNGNSKGFSSLSEDYYAYAEEVNSRRAFPDVRDGLKVVQRRIVDKFRERNQTSLTKSIAMVGGTSEAHPHGDSAIYEAIVKMVDSNGSWGVPLIHGQGSFGTIYTPGAAEPRYTEVAAADAMLDFWDDYEYIPFVRKEVGDGVEPEVLASKYPFILTVGHSGIGVGMSSNIPPFNFWDVLDLTQLYLEEGKFPENAYILPDFPTGGFIVDDAKEAVKMMYTGGGRYITRAAYEKFDHNIAVYEIPYGTTIDRMVEKINLLAEELDPDMQFRATASDGLGTSGLNILVYKGTSVDDVEVLLYRKGILQTRSKAYMVWTTEDGEVRQGGVYPMIEEWVRFRRGIVETRLKDIKESLENEMDRLAYFINLVNNTEWRDTYLDKLVNVSTTEAKDYLYSIFEDIPKDVVDWIADRKASSFNRSNVYAERYNRLSEDLEQTNEDLNNINGVIIREFDELRVKHAGKFERKCEPTDIHITPRRDHNGNVVTPGVECTFSWSVENGTIIMHTNSILASNENLVHFQGDSKDTLLLGLCADGSIAKIWASSLKMDEETSIRALSGLPVDPYMVIEPVDADLVLMHADGGVSFWNPSNEVTARKNSSKKNVLPAVTCPFIWVNSNEVESFSWIYHQEGDDYPAVATAYLGDINFTRQTFTKAYPFGRKFGVDIEANHYAVNVEPESSEGIRYVTWEDFAMFGDSIQEYTL